MQKFYLYLTLTKPSDELIVSYTRVDTAGAALRRSYLIGTLQRLFPQVAVEEIERESPADYLASERTLHGFVSEALRGICGTGIPKRPGTGRIGQTAVSGRGAVLVWAEPAG